MATLTNECCRLLTSLVIRSSNGIQIRYDWMNKGAENIIQRVVNGAHPGDIVLLHASDSCKQTHLALPTIIDSLRANGYEFATVSEMLQLTELNGIKVPDQGS